MFYLILAIVASCAIAVVMRFAEEKVHNNMAMFFWNYAMCVGLSAIYSKGNIFPKTTNGLSFAIFLGVITGILYLGGFVFLKWNIRHNGVMLTATFQKLGVVIPTVMAIVVFGESPKVAQLIGLAFALAAILIINLQKSSEDRNENIAKETKTFKLGLLAILCVCGFADAMSNIYDKLGNAEINNQYLLFTFVVSTLLSLVLAITSKEGFHKEELLYGLGLGIPNYYSIRFLLLSLGEVPAIVVYPVFSASCILLVTATSIVLFKEKLTKRKAIAIGCVILALICLNLS